MKRIFTSLVLVLSFCLSVKAQLLSGQCESSPCNALPICDTNLISNNISYTSGTAFPIGTCANSNGSTVLYTAASNTVYYRFTCYQTGTLNFKIIANDVSANMDWALFNITTSGCSTLGVSNTIECNNVGGGGATGIGGAGALFEPSISVTAGNTYILAISRASGGTVTTGFTLDFTGTTASLRDNVKPYFVSVVPFDACSPVTTLKIKLSEPVRCSQLGGAGAPDFSITNNPTFTDAGANCPGCSASTFSPHYGNLSDTIVITFASALAPGNYTITPLANGFRDVCANSDSTAVTLSFTVPVRMKDSVRFGFNCSTLSYIDTVYAVGGVGPYQFKDSSVSTSNVFVPSALNYKIYTGVVGGSTHKYTIKDNLNCTADTTITHPVYLQINPYGFYKKNIQCHDDFLHDSIKVILIGGGVMPYTFSILPNTGSTGGIIYNPTPQPTWSNLLAGIYTVTVTDNYGCTLSNTQSITNPPVLNFTLAPTVLNPLCFGDSTGKITLQVTNPTGGTAPYTFSILPSYSNTTITTGPNAFNNLPAGTYTIKVTDANGCTATTTATLSSNPQIVMTSPILVPPTCTNPCSSGTYQPNAIGGIGGKKYYLLPYLGPGLWDYSDSIYAGHTKFGLAPVPLCGSYAGTVYTVLIKDAANCTATTTFTLTLPPKPVITATTITPPLCNGGNGTIISTVTNGTGTYTAASYTYTPITGGITTTASGTSGTTGTYSNVPFGTYDIIVTNTNGCKDTDFAVQMTQPSQLVWDTVNKVNVLCYGNNTGSIFASTAGATDSIRYSITPLGPQLQKVPNGNGVTFINLTAQCYTITARDANNCSITTQVCITQPIAAVTASVLLDSAISCFGNCNGEANATGGGGVPPYIYYIAGPGTPTIDSLLGEADNLCVGTYTITVKDANQCTKTTTITLTQPAVLNSLITASDTIKCAGTCVATASITPSGGTSPYSYTIAGTGTPIINASGSVGNATGMCAGSSYTITVTDAHLCTTSKVINIIANPIPVLSAIANQVVCNGTPTTVVIFASTVPSTTFSWTVSTNIGLIAGSGNSIPSFNATNNGTTPIIDTIIVTPTGPATTNCVGAPVMFTITVNPTPIITANGNDTLCAGSNTLAYNFNSSVSGTTYTWTNTNTSIGLSASGIGNIPVFIGLNPGITPNTGFVTVTPFGPGAPFCQGQPDTFNITVNPIPVVNSISNQIICAGTSTAAINFLPNNVAGTTYAWSMTASSDIGSGFNGTGTSIPSFTSINTTNLPIVATYTVTPTGPAPTFCAGAAQTFTITVNPTPVITAIADDTLCAGSNTLNYAFASSVSGTTFTWTNSNAVIGLGLNSAGPVTSIPTFVAANPTTNPITATIIVTPSANTCPGANDTFNITVNPIPVVNTIPNQIVCAGTSTSTVTFLPNNVAGTTYAWSMTASSNIGSGFNGTGSSIPSFTALNATSFPIVATYTVTPTGPAPTFCVGATQTFTITVNPTPIVTATADDTLCAGTSTIAYNFNSTVLGTTYSWINSNTNTGLAQALGIGNIPSFSTTNNTNAPLTSVIIVTPIANSCPGANDTFNITVNPIPVINAISNQTLCAGATTSAINFLPNNVAGTTYSWSMTASSDIGSGFNGTGTSIPSFTALNSTSVPVIATYTVTPTGPAPTFCVGATQTFTITVNPTTVLTASVDDTLCAGTNSLAYNFAATVSGTTFSWTNSNTAIGLGNPGIGNIPSFVATNSTNAPISGTIIVTSSANGCPGNIDTFNITVNPIPVLNPISNQTLCAGSTTTTVNFLPNNVAGTTYAWSMTASSDIGSGFNGTGTSIPSFTALNATNAPIVATYTVTPTGPAPTFCVGATQTFTITVNPTTVLTATADDTLCAGTNSLAYNFAATVSGTTFSWTNSNTAIGLGNPGIGNIPSFVATNSTNAPISGTIIVTSSANGCPGNTDTFNITVNPIPVLNPISGQTLCANTNTSTVLFSNNVTGTTYSWTASGNIGSATFGNDSIPSFTAINTFTTPVLVTYTVTPTGPAPTFCVGATQTFNIIVNPSEDASFSYAGSTYCQSASNPSVIYTPNTNLGGVFSYAVTSGGPLLSMNTSTGAINLAASNLGQYVVSYATTGPCPDTATFNINITNAPKAGPFHYDSLSYCQNDVNPSPVYTAPASGGIFSATPTGLNIDVNSGAITLASSNAGTYTVKNLIVAAGGCAADSATTVVTIDSVTVLTQPSNVVLCNGSNSTTINFASSVLGSTYSWTKDATAIGLVPTSGTGSIPTFTAVNTGINPIVSTFTVTPNANGCDGLPLTFTITVNPTPSITPTANDTLCDGSNSLTYNFSSTVGGTSFAWTNDNIATGLLQTTGNTTIPSFVATNSGTSSITSVIIVTPSANLCPGIADTFSITVNPIPTITLPLDDTLCNGTASPIYTFTSTVSGTTFAWTNSDPSIGLVAANGTGSIASFVGTNASNAPITSTITVTPTGPAPTYCAGTPQSFTITINPTPNVFAINADDTLCVGSSTSATFVGNVAGTVFNWTNSNINIGIGASDTGSIANFTTTNTNTFPITGTIIVTPNLDGCLGIPDTFTITVAPIPTMTNLPNQMICNGSTIGALNFVGGVTGTTYNWTATSDIGAGLFGTGNIPSFTGVNNGNTPIIDTFIVTPTGPSPSYCVDSNHSFTITVNPTPTITANVDDTLCAGTSTIAYNFNSTVLGTTYTWTNSNTSTGLAQVSGTGNIPPFTATNNTNGPITSVIVVTPSANGCPGIPDTFSITVNPNPVINTIPNQTLCASATTSTVNFLPNNVAGTTYAWSMTASSDIGSGFNGTGSSIPAFTALNATNAPIVATYTVTPTGPAPTFCAGATQTFTITVNPTTVLTASADDTLCAGTNSLAYNFATTVSGTTLSWTNSNTAIGLGNPGTGNILSFVTTNNTNAPITGTIVVTSSANGCPGNIDTFNITVNPIPVLNPISNQTLCANTNTTTVLFSGNNVTGTTYSWSNGTTFGNDSIPSFTAITAGTTTYTVTPTGPAPTYCVGLPQQFTITINPAEDASFSYAGSTYCQSGTNPTPVFTANTNLGGTFSYSVTSGGPTLVLNSSTGVINLATSNLGTYVVSYATTGPCPDTATFNITITNAPSATFSYDSLSYCQSETNPIPTFAVGSSAGAFSVVPAGLNFVNLNTGVIDLGNSNAGTYTITNFIVAAGGCASATATTVVTIDSTTVLNQPLNVTLCNTDISPIIPFTSSVIGSTYTWTKDATAIGLGSISGTGSIPSFTAVNAGSNPIVSTFTVTPHANGCDGLPLTFTITVNPTPIIVATADDTLCVGDNASYTFTSNIGSIYTWTAAPTIGLATGGNTNPLTFTTINGGATQLTVPIIVTPSANTCIGISDTFNVTVNPTPFVNAIANQTVCNGAITAAINFGGVTGSTYAWSMSNAIGTTTTGTGNIPSFTAVTGLSPISSVITVTPTGPAPTFCAGTASTFTITVNPSPTITPTIDDTICVGASPAYAFSSSLSGSTFAWINLGGAAIGLGAGGNGTIPSFTAVNATAGPLTNTIVVTPTSASSCPGVSDTFKITVMPTPVLNAITNQTLCAGNNTTATAFTSNVAGTTYSWNMTSSNGTDIGSGFSGTGTIPSFTSVNTGTTPIVATYTVTPQGTLPTNCIGATQTFTITVNPSQNAAFSYLSSTYCKSGVDPTPTITGTIGGTFTSDAGVTFIGTSGQIDLSSCSVATHTITYITPGPCPDTATFAISIVDSLVCGFSYANASYCRSAANPSPIFVTGGSAGTFSATPAGLVFTATPGQVDLVGSAPGTYTVTNTIAASGSCPGVSCTSTITVKALPTLTLTTLTNAGCNPTCNGTITTSGGTGGSGSGYTYSIAPLGTSSINGLGVASGLCAGTLYTMTVTDGLGCTGTFVDSVSTSSPPIVSTVVTNVTFAGAGNGKVVATGAGGSGSGYIYTISPIAPQGPVGTFTSLSDTVGGVNPCYTITCTDSKGCTVTTIICLTGPGALNVLDSIPVHINVKCNGGATGSFDAYATGGTAPYTYSVAGPNSPTINATTGLATGLTFGSYTVTVTDAAGTNPLTATTVIVITQPNPLFFTTPVITKPGCNPGCDGTISISSTGGSGPKIYTIASPVGQTPACNPLQLTAGNFTQIGTGSYTITVTDSALCSHDTIINIVQSSSPTITSNNHANPSCNNTCNGTITVVANGGTGALNYSLNTALNTPATSGAWTALCSGIYTINVVDTKGCTVSVIDTLKNPPALIIDSMISYSPLCNGNGNGTIHMYASGGTGAIIYSIIPIATQTTPGYFTGLSNGTYTVTGTDASGCSITSSVTLTMPTALVWQQVASNNISCHGANDGTINVAASGGTVSYQYSKNNGTTFGSSGSFGSLSAATYTVVVKDANGCTISTTITIVDPALLVLSAPVVTNVNCNGGSDGTITVTASGGTSGTYTYSIVPGVQPNNTTGIFTGLPFGTYVITAKDSNSCTISSANITINQPAPLTFNGASHQDVACFGDATGSITTSLSGGSPAYVFTLSPNLGLQGPNGFWANLPAGIYVVTGTDAHNCTVSTVITIIQHPQLQITNVVYTEPVCNGDANGSMVITGIGGFSTLSYAIIPNMGTQNPAGTFNGIPAGSYATTLSDILGCHFDTTLVLTQPLPVGAVLNLRDANCVGSEDGKVYVQGTGGRGGYKYYITPGLHINKSGVFDGFSAGTYTLKVVDTSGCEYLTTFTINPPSNPLQNTITKQDLACNGAGNEGQATANVSGGTPPYTYVWSTSPVQTTPVASTLYYGFYNVEVTDANGCILKDTVYIEEGPCCDVAFIPNAFTPNGDGNNDEFRILTTAGVETIQLDIYNRWGKKVWTSSNYRLGWDGTIDGKDGAMDTYYYIFRYRCTRDGNNYTKKGDVILVR